jgi:hypothetical protein
MYASASHLSQILDSEHLRAPYVKPVATHSDNLIPPDVLPLLIVGDIILVTVGSPTGQVVPMAEVEITDLLPDRTTHEPLVVGILRPAADYTGPGPGSKTLQVITRLSTLQARAAKGLVHMP